ncbi:MAG: MBL fold metallo-hydrolase [Pseudomonadota bacterium]
MASLSFYGAAGTVTGSSSLVSAAGHRLLIDCGMFQGNKSVAALNDKPFPYEPNSVDSMVLTHAHIDHSGLIPKLVKNGFGGPIHTTAPTADLLDFMLMDSAAIQESEAERANRRRSRKGKKKIQPAYTRDDARKALSLLKPRDYEERFEIAPGIQARLWNAGHMLGSASVDLRIDEPGAQNALRMLFSGDIGPEEKAFHPEPDAPNGYDYLVCESTYGDRDRDDYTLEARRAALKKELQEALARGGNVVIPSFAVERSQELLHDIGVLLAGGEIPDTTVFLDSPLASKVTRVFMQHTGDMSDIDLPPDELFRHPSFHITESVDDSKAINKFKGGAIIISASGMCNAGRIKHHLRNNLWRENATVLFVGYQAPGTLGSIIRSGAEDVRIHGREVKVRARIRSLGNYSAHADQGELLDWIFERCPVPGAIFLNHGEDDARGELKRKIAERGVDEGRIYLPALDESFELQAGTPASKGRGAERVPMSQVTRDWQNEYAALLLNLSRKLDATDDPEKKNELLARLKTALEG